MLAALYLCLAACSNLTPDFDEPTVSISSFKLEPGQGQGPVFNIGLRIVNPNNVPLRLNGAAYTISLEGYDILTGVADELPTIEAFSEATVAINAQASLIDSIRFFNKLLQQPGDKLSYEFKAKLDTDNFVNAIRVTDSGEVSLKPDTGAPAQAPQAL